MGTSPPGGVWMARGAVAALDGADVTVSVTVSVRVCPEPDPTSPDPRPHPTAISATPSTITVIEVRVRYKPDHLRAAFRATRKIVNAASDTYPPPADAPV